MKAGGRCQFILKPPGEGRGGKLHMSRYGDVPLFWVLFWGCSRIFGYLFGLFPDFWVSFFGYSRIFGCHFLVKFHFFRKNEILGY